MGKFSLGLGAGVLLVMLAGCDGPPPHVTPVPTPSVTAVFASDEEALAAAEASYAAYLAVADQIFAEGGVHTERLEEVASGDLLASETSGFEDVAAKGWHSTGRSAFDSVVLQQYEPETWSGIVSVYLCDDVSAVDVIGPDGASVVSATRPSRTFFEVRFDYDPSRERLLISGHDVWGDGKC